MQPNHGAGQCAASPRYRRHTAPSPTVLRPGTTATGADVTRRRRHPPGPGTREGDARHNRCTFTTKTPVDNVLACREFETVVTDPEQMHHAIIAMGYRPTVRVVKQRRTARVGPYSLCVDDVEGVGAFLEVEAVAEGTADMATLQETLAAWVDGLAAPLERTGATYDQVVQQATAPA